MRFLNGLYRKMKDQNPSISEDFTKTFLKWPRHGLETTWRKCWSSLRKRVLRKLLRISYRRLKAGCSVCILCLFVTESFDWDRMKCTRCERLLLPFYLFVFFFPPHLKITLDSVQPMLKEKRIIPSVWGEIKSFDHFQRGEYFSDWAFN